MWDCLAKLPKREHVAAAAEHEHWSNTFFLKQTTAGGTGTIVTTKHPVLQKAKDWRREHVRFSHVFRTEDPSTHANGPGPRRGLGDRKSDVERAFHDVSGRG